MSLVDNFLSCAETPLWVPITFDISTLQTCMSCSLKLTADIGGPGNIRPQETYGLVFEESPLATLSINGIQHNTFRSHMVFPGAHKLPGTNSTYPCEVIIYFQNTKMPGKHVCLILPIDIGVGDTNEYFYKLTNDVRNDRPPMTTLLHPKLQFLSFDGASLNGRTLKDSRPRERCDPTQEIVTYYIVLEPLKILHDDYARLRSLHGGGQGPPKPVLDIMPDRLRKLGTIINGITLVSKGNDSDSKNKKNGVATNAMKCYRLNTDKDIVGDRVYVNGKDKPGTSLLSDELIKAATELNTPTIDTSTSSIQVADVEKYIGIAIGVALGLIVTATIAFYVYKFVFKSYLSQQKLYKNIPSVTT